MKFKIALTLAALVTNYQANSFAGQTDKEVVCKDCQTLTGLSPFWAQKYIGSDLAKDLVAKRTSSNRPSIAVWDVCFTNDCGFDSHGVKVENLIAGIGKQAVSNPTEIIEFLFNDEDAATWVEQKLKIKSQLPALVNLSSMMGDKQALALQTLSEHGTVSVIGAGNDFPTIHAHTSGYALLEKKFVVGSLSPFGLVSGFSEESEIVTILAPSDFYLTSAFKPEAAETYTGFDGTSGATPMVTGSIANVLTILPGLKFDSILKLVQKTAIPTIANLQQPLKNGAGLINAYFMVRVAERIAEACSGENLPLECADKKMSEEESYLFPISAALIEKLKSQPCSSKLEEGVEVLLRKEALIHPNVSYLWARLSCNAKNANFDIEADYYHRLALISSGIGQRYIEKSLRKLYEIPSISKYKVINDSQKSSIMRALIQLGYIGVDFVNQKLASTDPVERMLAMDALSALGETSLYAVREGMNDDDRNVRTHALSDCLSVGIQSLPLISSAYAKEVDSDSRVSLVQTACALGASALPFLFSAAHDESFMVRYYLERGLEGMGKAAVPLLEVLAKDSDLTVKNMALQQLLTLSNVSH